MNHMQPSTQTLPGPGVIMRPAPFDYLPAAVVSSGHLNSSTSRSDIHHTVPDEHVSRAQLEVTVLW